ncbi:MAG: class I SAM-dependent methyltransferase [Actinomycetota bacterium]
MDILLCKGCGTLRASRVLAPETVYVEGYHKGEGDLHPFDYTAPLSLEHERLNNSKRLDHLREHVRGGRLLDVGGGIGTLASQAIELGFDATNLEPISEAVEYSKARSVPTILGTLDDLDPSTPPYDAITMMHVLEHLPECRRALESIWGWLLPGGYVMVEVPHYGSMSRIASGQAWLGWWPGQHIYYFKKQSLSDVMRRAGFEVVDIGTSVLAFDGLILDHYAYIVGLGPPLKKVLQLRRRFRGKGTSFHPGRPGRPDSTAPVAATPSPIRDQPLKRRLILPVLKRLARVEEALGVGETLWAIGKRPL